MKFRSTVFVLCFCGIIAVTYARNFYVAAPKMLRLNAEETVAIAMDGADATLVNITVQDHPQRTKTITSRQVALEPGKPKIVTIRLDPNDFPSNFFTTPDRLRNVSLTANFQTFNKEIVIPVTSQSGYMFIQTDKPVYTPRQRVLFRIIPVSEEIRESKEPFQLVIKNPKNIIVEEKNYNEKQKRYNRAFVNHIFKFPSNPILGEWSATVRYGHDMEQISTVHFTVKEYVVPTFTVELMTPDVILPKDEEIEIKISAKYVYGKIVQGIVHLRLGVRKPNALTADFFGEVPGRELDGKGTYTLRLQTQSIKQVPPIGWFPELEGSYLIVEATVVDSATGKRETAIDVKCRFSSNPFVISFDQCLRDFKPGLTSVFEADITYVGGNPADGILTRITAVGDDGEALIIAHDTAITDENGKVTFEIQPEVQHNKVTITLETIDENFKDSQAKETFEQNSYKSTNNAYLAISRSSPQRLRPGDVLGKEIHFQPPEIRDIYYMVIAKGKILDVRKLPSGEFKTQRVDFQISYDMIPSFRLLVFAHYQDELIVDSLKIDVESVCHPNAQVTIRAEFYDLEPGNSGKILINGKKGSTVGLIGVNEATHALSRRDLLTKAKLFNTLGSHDLGCGRGGGSSAESVLGNAGITMGTNLYTPNQVHSCAVKSRKKRDISNEDIGTVPLDFVIPPDLQEDMMNEMHIRSDFRETWLFEAFTIGEEDKLELHTSLPHSITTWFLQAVTLSPENGMCVAEPMRIVSFKKIFLQLNLPYSVVRNEQVEIQATVFNYDAEKIYAHVYMLDTVDLCSGSQAGEKSEKKTVLVESWSAVTVTFSVILMEVKDYPIKVYVMSTRGGDAIERLLHVVPEGITKEIDINVNLDPTNSQRRQEKRIQNEYLHDQIDSTKKIQFTAIKLGIPEGFVPGTASCYITAMGTTFRLDAVETSVKNAQGLIRIPSGSGETNMMGISLTLYTINYLKAIGNLTAHIDETGSDYIRRGYDNELEFRRDDGSYSTFRSLGPITWLTAFVVKVFCQATQFILIDRNVSCSGVKWLVQNQEADGSYIEKTALYHKDMAAYVYMFGTADLCLGSQPGERGETKVLVESQSAATVTFPVIPMEVKDYPIKVAAMTVKGSDAIERTLHVVPEGITKEIDITIKLDPTNIQRRKKRYIISEYFTDEIDPIQNIQVTSIKLGTPEGFVPGTDSCYITAMGNTFGPAVETSVKNPQGLIKLPGGCGEQNMVGLAPTLYAMNYLKASDKLTANIEETGYEYIRKGYSNELHFRKDDGSYSTFKGSESSTWLTAFVIKVFCQATKLVVIDRNVLCSGVKWLIDHQEADGSYIEKKALWHKEMVGGVNGEVPLTAFILITLSECDCDENNYLMLAKQRAVSYLEAHINKIGTPLPAAIVSYALALVNSDMKNIAIEKLLALATYDEDTNRLYWQTPESAQDIETAGYALMALLLSKDMVRSNSIVNWLNTKQLQSGAFKSTQDTVVALQALSKFAIEDTTPVNLVSNITSSNDMNFHQVLTFNDDNALMLQDVRVDKMGGTIFIKTSGQGQGILTAKLRYNVIVPTEDICRFEVEVEVSEVKDFVPVKGARRAPKDLEPSAIADMYKLKDDMSKPPPGVDRVEAEAEEEPLNRRVKRQNPDGKAEFALNITLCVRYLGNKEAGMSIVDVGTFSGFEPYIRDLEKLEDDENHLIKLYETSSRSVVFYLEKVPTNKKYCFNYHVLRKFYIGNIQMSAIKVYDYYNPDEACTIFFRPDNGSAMLQTICKDDKQCDCAEGGCPPEKPFSKYMERDTAKTREKMIEAFCEIYDFLWKGRVKEQKKTGNGFINITFEIDEIVKPGIENIKGETRTLLMRDTCKEPLFVGSTYLIAGKDGKAYQNERGVLWYRYMLDKTSAVYLYGINAEDRKLQRHLEYVTKDLSVKGCDFYI